MNRSYGRQQINCVDMDLSEYKHVVPGLIFLKYISDSFEEVHTQLRKEKDADPEDRDEYLAQNVFRVPKEARQPFLQGKANQVSKKNLFLILEKPS